MEPNKKIVFTAPPPGLTNTTPTDQALPPQNQGQKSFSESSLRTYSYDAKSITKKDVGAGGTYLPENKPVTQNQTPNIVIANNTELPNPIPNTEPAPVNTPSSNIRSFAFDIKSTVDQKGVSLAQMVLAENRSRTAGSTPITFGETDGEMVEGGHHNFTKWALILIGGLAVIAGLGAMGFVYLKGNPNISVFTSIFSPSNPTNNQPDIPEGIIYTESSVTLNPRDSYRETLISEIKSKLSADIPLGKLQSFLGYDSPVELLNRLGAHLPDTLQRSLRQEYAFGFHSWIKNEPYLILITDSFDNAYAGMLEWEKNIPLDLGPIFYDEKALLGATSTDQIVIEKFVDRIYNNKDVRVIENREKKPILLWSILDRNIIIITTNGDTLNEINRRLTSSSVVR